MGTGTNIAQDIKAGLKGIRGAGEAVRGSTLEATDELFDNSPNHPATQASKMENRSIAEKGKQDLRGADAVIGQGHGVAAASSKSSSRTTPQTVRGSAGTAAPAATGRTGDEYVSGSNIGA
ncbi:hypothetical protein VSDG_01753 [Cytospora chrysosperma]|uniref:Uncharacterized protein n=1 Tax=Cytospora chrysosperma TaxID=252740 RepID=A0A423WHL6_CYTCH|nr:hypothetical protein VSDG_01753 [Valsa sordida]